MSPSIRESFGFSKEEEKKKDVVKPEKKQDFVPEDKAPEMVYDEVKTEEPVKEETTRFVMATDDVYIADRMKAQPKTLDGVLKVREKKYAPGEHRLSLPRELRQFEDRFIFHWINKHKRAIDEAIDVKGWVIVNRTLFPSVPTHLFTLNGAIERGDLILGFMPRERGEEIRRTPGRKSTEMLRSYEEKGKDKLPSGMSGFYKPEDTTGESEEAGGLQEGKDF